jgi:hypothetical protein
MSSNYQPVHITYVFVKDEIISQSSLSRGSCPSIKTQKAKYFEIYIDSYTESPDHYNENVAYETKYWNSEIFKFALDLRLIGGFLMVLRFPPPIKLTATI